MVTAQMQDMLWLLMLAGKAETLNTGKMAPRLVGLILKITLENVEKELD